MINFKAKYNSNSTIKRLNKKQKYDNIPAYFVELDVNSKKDLKDGYNGSLDELKELRSGGKNFIAKFELEEKERTGIKKSC